MPTVLAQSNLPKSAAVVVSSETIILRNPNNNILEKYTSDEQKQLALKSYGVKPDVLLSPNNNKSNPRPEPPIVIPEFDYKNGTEMLGIFENPPEGISVVENDIRADEVTHSATNIWVGRKDAESFTVESRTNRFVTIYLNVAPGMYLSFNSVSKPSTYASGVFFDKDKNVFPPSQCIYDINVSNFVVPEGAAFLKVQILTLSPATRIKSSYTQSLFGFSNINNQNSEENG